MTKRNVLITVIAVFLICAGYSIAIEIKGEAQEVRDVVNGQPTEYGIVENENLISQETIMMGVSHNRTKVVDLIGAKANPTNYNAEWATTTAIYQIGENTDTFNIFLYESKASSTANVSFRVSGSNDDDCASSSVASGDEIAWFDLAPLSADSGAVRTYQATTTDFVWKSGRATSANPTGKSFQFTNVNVECVQLNLAAASTTIWASLKTKMLNLN